MTEVSPNVLRNRGVPIQVAHVVQVDRILPDGSQARVPERNLTIVDGEERIQEVEVFIRFTNNTFADIEGRWGSLEAFQQAAEATPKSTLREALAIIWGVDARTAGEMMLPGYDERYTSAIGAAMAVANGVDPFKAIRLLEATGVAMAELSKVRDQTVEELLAEAEEGLSKVVSLGAPGSAPGSASARRKNGSGTSRQPKSST